MGKVYIFMKKYSKALELSNKAIDIDSSRWIYYSVRGIANFSLKNYEQSRDDYEVVLKHDDSFSVVWYRKGYCHLQLSEYEDAIKCLKKAIDWNVKVYEDVHLCLALTYFKVEKFKNALDEVNLHCDNNPKDNIGLILMGDVYRALGNVLKAEESYVKAYKLKPNNYKVLKLLVNFSLNKNELERAFEYLRRMLEVNMNDEKLCIYFLWLCAELNALVIGEAAFVEYEKMLKYNINSKVNPYALYYYGVILYKKGLSESMYRAAAEKLEKAIQLGLKNGDLFCYLSMIYYELGDKDNSIKYAKEALIIEPDNIEYKTRYKGILKYIEKRNLFIFKVRPIAKNKWSIKRHLEHKALEINLPVLNIEIGENYEEDV
jgi:tetratricopeptide (TPR) repeat protein